MAEGFTRSAAKEAAAIARGVTKEEIERRGGINAAGYWGDTYNPNTSLTDAEYAAAIAGKTGLDIGKAINAALDKKLASSTPAGGNTLTGTGVVPKTIAEIAAAEDLAAKNSESKSAYDLLYTKFKEYGLESLITPLKGFIQDGIPDAEFTIKLRETPEYQKRFAANAKRIANGFKAVDEATYLGLEDAYQSIAQNYGMPPQYYAKGELGVQSYFEDSISKNIDPVTFEERIVEGKKIMDANRYVLDAAKKFFPTLNDGDFLAYVLDPKNAITDIQRKVTAAEIGGAQLGAGLEAMASGANALATAGVTSQRYQQNVPNIAETTVRGSQLASMYGENPYTQQTAEQAILNVPGSVDAIKQTEKLKKLEEASFSKRIGAAQGALGRERAGVL